MLSLPDSLWAATAEPAPETTPLTENAEVNVAVIGAGFAGLSTALHLAAKGKSVQVLEAGEIGWGASGRSGGQVIPGIKYDPDDMVVMFGEESGLRAAGQFGSTAAKVFELIDRYAIACDDTRAGWVQPAHSQAGLKTAEKRFRQWKTFGADVDWLGRSELADMLGSDAYLEGWIDRRGGSIQPLSYTRGLARAALCEGVSIATQTPVMTLARHGAGWTLALENGKTVSAQQVAVCTNAYSKGLWPRLAETYIAANSFQVATSPLSDNISQKILRGGIVASDTRRLLAYFRRDAAGRLIMGGRGTFADPNSTSDFAHVERMLVKSYPELANQPIEFRWAGRVAITRDALPHLHEPEPGLFFLLGCQGRGVALQSKMGEWIADYLATGRSDALPVPVTPIAPIPFHELRRLYVAATVAYYKLRDLVG